MTTYAQNTFVFPRIDRTGNSCVWIILKMAAAPLRRKRFSTTRSNVEESLANAEEFPCKAARRPLAQPEG